MYRFARVVLASPILLVAFAASSAPNAETQRVAQFENDHVKVWRSIIAPGNPLPPHRHDHGRVIVALHGGTMKIAEVSGGSDTHVWESGKSYWLGANAPGTLHTDENVGSEPIDVMVVEIEDDR